MTPAEIVAKADELRKTELTMSNYKVIVQDAFVLIRELAKAVEAKS